MPNAQHPLLNPLLTLGTAPGFSAFHPEQLTPALKVRLHACYQVLQQIQQVSHPTWETIVEPLEHVEEQLSQSWSIASHLHAVMNTPALRTVYQENLEKLTEYHNIRWQDEGLYQQLKVIQQDQILDPIRRRALDLEIEAFELSGVGLSEGPKKRLSAINEALSILGMQFENHIMDATDTWFYHTEHDAMLEGLPEHMKVQAREQAKGQGQTGYRLGLDMPTVQGVLTYAKSRELRGIFYQANSTRASDQGPLSGRFDNGPVMVELLKLQQEKAMLLGFEHFAALSLYTKMAKSVSTVIPFLEDLAVRSQPQALREFAELCQFAQRWDGRKSLESWDVGYYSEHFQEQLFSISQEALRPYFPLERVLSGLFELSETLFGMRFVPKQADVWHSDVRYFTVYRTSTAQTSQVPQVVGHVYMDLYARAHKRGGAWMDDYQSYAKSPTHTVLPVAFLTCNFTPPGQDQASTLTHEDVITLFHEFGHCIHHVFSTVEVSAVSGIHGVEWDAVELPSQFMENFCWQKEVIPKISSHVVTGEPLPEDILEALIQSRCFQSGMQMLRQLEFALFDLALYQDQNVRSTQDIQKILDQIRDRCAVLKPPEFNRFQNSFSHIFAGGYAAGYYSYKWAEILSSDAFDRFETEGVLNPAVGQSFLENILSQGGSQPAGVLFEKFRGRPPQMDALLRHLQILS